MLKNKTFLILGMILLALFVYGLIHLFVLRFERGDVYAYGSSLRSDPLGTKVLYEALDQCCDLNVRRSYEPFRSVKLDPDTVFLDLGDDAPGVLYVPNQVVADLELFIRRGGRLVICMSPYTSTKQFEASTRAFFLPEKTDEMKGLPQSLGFNLYSYSLSSNSQENRATRSDGLNGLPDSFSVHTVVYFSDLDRAWKVIYQRSGHAVVVERMMGKGSLILSAESYFLSNEAMLKERRPELLAWLVGNHRNVVFDEFDRGIAVDPGVASLLRKYHLQWFAAGFLVLAGLFVWRSAVSLVPPFAEEEEAQAAISSKGNDAASGLANLLRRAIPAGKILDVCYHEWAHARKALEKSKSQKMEEIVSEQKDLPARQKDPVKAYNRLSEILSEKDKTWKKQAQSS